MELVEATPDDVDALVEHWYTLARAMEQYDELNELVSDSIEDVSTDGFHAHFGDDTITDYLVVVDGDDVGFVTLSEEPHPSRTHARALRVVNLGLDERHQRQGHGTAIIERIREIARERDCDHLVVSCEWENEGARRFYREVGLRPKQVEYAISLCE